MSVSPAPEQRSPARPSIIYNESAFDRAAHLRAKAGELLELPEARGVLLGGEMVVLNKEGGVLFTVEEARRWSRGQPLFLGTQIPDTPDAGQPIAPRFAFSCDPAHEEELEAADLQTKGLRALAQEGEILPPMLGALAGAKALLAWHGRHRYCSNCGARTTMADSGWRRECHGCGGQHFPRTDPVVIMLVSREGQALLGRQAHFGPGMYSCLAGFVEPGEIPEEAVRRETMEEAGISLGEIRYFASQPWPFPMSLMLGFLAKATSADITMDPNELEDVRWVPRNEVAQMLARTHPEGLFAPGPEAIAHHLMRAFVDEA